MTTRERAEVMKRMKIPQGLDERQILFWYQSYCCRADNLVADLLAENERLTAQRDNANEAWRDLVGVTEEWIAKVEELKASQWSQQAVELRLAEAVRVTAEGCRPVGTYPVVLFDGYAVYQAMSEKAKTRTSPENVSDVLDAVVDLIRQYLQK